MTGATGERKGPHINSGCSSTRFGQDTRLHLISCLLTSSSTCGGVVQPEIIGAIIGGVFGVIGSVATQCVKQLHEGHARRVAKLRAVDREIYEKVRLILSDDAMHQLDTLEAYIGFPDWLWQDLRKFEYGFSDHAPNFQSRKLERTFKALRESVQAFLLLASGACVLHTDRWRTLPRNYASHDKQRFRMEAAPVDAAAKRAHKAAQEFITLAKKLLRA